MDKSLPKAGGAFEAFLRAFSMHAAAWTWEQYAAILSEFYRETFQILSLNGMP
ncbi:MAG: hypothetical protein QM473_01475 [Acidobacteriota bacterium]|nr:hypothetical protein [Acidobacteriota bacterium]